MMYYIVEINFCNFFPKEKFFFVYLDSLGIIFFSIFWFLPPPFIFFRKFFLKEAGLPRPQQLSTTPPPPFWAEVPYDFIPDGISLAKKDSHLVSKF